MGSCHLSLSGMPERSSRRSRSVPEPPRKFCPNASPVIERGTFRGDRHEISLREYSRRDGRGRRFGRSLAEFYRAIAGRSVGPCIAAHLPLISGRLSATEGGARVMAASAFIIREMAAGGVLGLRFCDLFCTRRCRAPMQIDPRRYSLEHGTSLGSRERLDDLFAYPRRQRRRASEPAPLGIREYRSRGTP